MNTNEDEPIQPTESYYNIGKNIEIHLTSDEKEDLDWAKKVFKTIDEKGKKLSSWEINFIANLNGQIQSGYPLTEAQLDKLAEIFHERCR